MSNSKSVGKISDGYHTFDELYEHRHWLFINLLNAHPKSWKSQLHHDKTKYEGMFIAGIFTDYGDQITYHMPWDLWHKVKCRVLPTAPTWDKHTPKDVIKRLKKMTKTWQR